MYSILVITTRNVSVNSFFDDTVGIVRKKKIGNNSKYPSRLTWIEMGKYFGAYKPSMICEILAEL